MPITRSSVRSAAAALMAASALVALSGCSSITVKDAAWPDAAAMHRSDDSSQVPSLVGADAQDVRLRVDQVRTGVQIAWTSASGITRDDCRRGDLTGSSAVGATWWPTSPPAQGWTCGWWKVFEQGGTCSAWDGREAPKA